MTEDELPGVWRETRYGPELDLCGLDAPEPMVGIVGRIESDPDRGPFVVHLPRDPIHLFAELAERGWCWEYLTREEGKVRLRLARAK